MSSVITKECKRMSMIFNEKIKSSSGVSFKTKLFTIVTAVTLSGAAAVLPLAAMADATMDALQAQIVALQAQLAALSGSSSSSTMTTGACSFTRSLTVGIKGDDVTCLQTYLESTGHFTYSGAKGYFGGITKASVAAWQAANGVSPAVGYFGSLSRAKYTMLMSTVTPTWTPTPTPTPTGTPNPTATPVAGSGLTVAAASSQPSEGALAPAVAARVPALHTVFTAASDGDVTVKSILVQRVGQADDSAIDSVVLVDDTGTQIGLSKTLNALHQVTLNEWVVIKAGTSKPLTIAFNRPVAGSNGGQIAKFQIVSVDAGTSKVTGAFPMIGPGVTINETLSIGTLASPARGVLDPGAARSSLQVGATAFYATGARWTVGSAEAVSLEQVRFYQAGSAGSGDLTNVMVTVKGTDYPTTVSSDGKYYVAKLSPPVVFDKGAIVEASLKADVAGGSNRTIDFDIQRRTDIVVKGNVFGFHIIPANGTTANTTTQGEGFTSTEPYYDAYQHTISTGSLRIEKSNSVPAGNVAVDTSNMVIGAFGFEAKGEQVQISSFKFTFSEGQNAGTLITGISLVDAAGATVAGPKDATSATPGTVTFSDTFTVPVGYNVYKVLAKLSTSFADGQTISASTTPGSDITAKGMITGLTLTPTPSTAVGANTMTIRKAGLKVSVSDSPVAQNVVRGVNGYLFSRIQYDATASGEDIRVTSQDIQIVTSGSADADALNTCQIFDGATALNTGGNVVNPSGNTAGDDVEGVFTLDNNLIIPKGTVKLADVKCNIGQDATGGETWSLGLVAASDTVVVGKDTGVSVTETITVNNGQTMTVRASGSFTVAIDSSSPSERFGIAGKTDVASTIFKLTGTHEAIKLTKFGFSLASSTASTSDVLKVSFWDGATKVGEAVFTSGNFRATTTLTSDFIIPKDGDKILSTTVDLISKSSIGKANTIGGDSGHLVIINWDASALVATEGIGQSSGTTLNSTASTDPTTVKGIRVIRTYPTLERLAVPTNTLANGDMDLYRFKVTAPADGDVGLYKFTFRVSSTSVATTSSFRVFAYSTSDFGTQAYAINPINSNDVSCVGGGSLELANTTNCNSNVQALGYASSSLFHINVWFDPVTNTAATPNAEAIQVPAGQSRYFKLVGNVARTTTGDSFSVALIGDTSFFPTLTTPGGSGIADNALSNASLVASSSRFVWSPDTTTTSATTSNDWLNGYLLPGLPTTEMSQQTFSK
ncbi:MAG: peptidoglycan-binding protein [Patescibacteria group bacterium]